jgi:RimJ/RimL family protein N-acetyltransferase
MLTYFHWANEAEARKQSYRSDAIPLAEHSRWFAARLADPGTRLWVAEASGDPAGQIRFQRDGDTVWISFSVDARFRGRGIGGFLLREGVRLLKEESPWPTLRIRGAVKKSNLASRKAFLRSGYIESETSLHGEASFIFTHPG